MIELNFFCQKKHNSDGLYITWQPMKKIEINSDYQEVVT